MFCESDSLLRQWHLSYTGTRRTRYSQRTRWMINIYFQVKAMKILPGSGKRRLDARRERRDGRRERRDDIIVLET